MLRGMRAQSAAVGCACPFWNTLHPYANAFDKGKRDPSRKHILHSCACSNAAKALARGDVEKQLQVAAAQGQQMAHAAREAGRNALRQGAEAAQSTAQSATRTAQSATETAQSAAQRAAEAVVPQGATMKASPL